MEALRRAGARDLEMVPLSEDAEEENVMLKRVGICAMAVIVVVLVGAIPTFIILGVV